MLANLENSVVATGLEKVSFHSNSKEGQCQKMFKLQHNCIHFICYQSYSQNLPSQASTVCELRTSKYSSWIQKRQRNQRSNCQHPLDGRKSKRIQKNISFCFTDYAKVFDCVYHKKLWKILMRWEYKTSYLPPVKPACRSRSNSQDQAWNNRLVANWEKSMSRVYIANLLSAENDRNNDDNNK